MFSICHYSICLFRHLTYKRTQLSEGCKDTIFCPSLLFTISRQSLTENFPSASLYSATKKFDNITSDNLCFFIPLETESALVENGIQPIKPQKTPHRIA